LIAPFCLLTNRADADQLQHMPDDFVLRFILNPGDQIIQLIRGLKFNSIAASSAQEVMMMIAAMTCQIA